MPNIYHYYVEGECEKKLVDTLKDNSNRMIVAGKVDVFNVQQEVLTSLHLLPLKRNTTIILIYDTDKKNEKILNENLKVLKDNGFKDVICIAQNKNIEDELIRSTNIKDIKELLNSKSNKDFKTDFIKENKLLDKLKAHKFDISKMWINHNDEDKNIKI